MNPSQARGLVLALGTAGQALHTFYDFQYSWILFRGIERTISALGEVSNQVMRPLLRSPLAWTVSKRFKLVDPYYMEEADLLPYLEHLATLDLPTFFQNVIETDRHDCWSLLPELQMPVLVIAAENDTHPCGAQGRLRTPFLRPNSWYWPTPATPHWWSSPRQSINELADIWNPSPRPMRIPSFNLSLESRHCFWQRLIHQ